MFSPYHRDSIRLFGNHDDTEIKSFIYNPQRSFLKLDAPICYAYAYMRASYYNESESFNMPMPCYRILRDANLVYAKNKEFFDLNSLKYSDEVDKIFKRHLSDDYIKALNIVDASDEPIETVDEFMDEFEHAAAFTLLMGGKLEADESKFDTIQKMSKQLLLKGPLMSSGSFGLNLDENLQNDASKVLRVDSYSFQGQHSILIIGIDAPSHSLLYCDPNYPQLTLAISFEKYSSLTSNYSGVCYLSDCKVQPKYLESGFDGINPPEWIECRDAYNLGKKL